MANAVLDLVGSPSLIATGSNSLAIGTNGAGNLKILSNGLERFYIDGATGNLTQNATSGGSLVLSKAGTSIAFSTQTSISAAGSTIDDATQLSSVISIVNTVSAGQGVKLWDPEVGTPIFLHNRGGAGVLVYPPSASQSINAGAGGAAVTVASGYCLCLWKISATAWSGMYAIQAS